MVALDEVRKLLRLALDLRDLPRQSAEQRLLALEGLAALTGAQVALWLEIEGVTSGQGIIRDPLDFGWACERERRVFRRYVESDQLRALDPSIPRMARVMKGPTAIFSRDQLLEDRDWYASDHVQEFRREARVDSFIYASFLGPADRGHTISLHRSWGAAPFGEHERALVEVFHRECAFLHQPATAVRPALLRGLAPRLRETLGALARGLSEKQVAAELGISPHTAHEYVKTLHRHFGVQSRAELLSLCLAQSG
jgi:DNA-binding CsgD family transcriptional regulator